MSGVELGSSFILAAVDVSRPRSWRVDRERDSRPSPGLRGLMVDGFAGEAEICFPDPTKIDDPSSPADLMHVVDADGLPGSRDRDGSTGPQPGCSGASRHRKVADDYQHHRERRARRKVRTCSSPKRWWRRRLCMSVWKRVGLGDLCLELHSRAANKRAVALELGATLSASCPAP